MHVSAYRRSAKDVPSGFRRKQFCAWISPLQINNRTEPLTQREPWRREAATSHRKHEHTSAAGTTPPRPAPRPAPLRLRTRTPDTQVPDALQE